MECLFCGSAMDCVQSEVKPVPGSWYLSYAVAWWECDECDAENVFDGGAGPLDDPVDVEGTARRRTVTQGELGSLLPTKTLLKRERSLQ